MRGFDNTQNSHISEAMQAIITVTLKIEFLNRKIYCFSSLAFSDSFLFST